MADELRYTVPGMARIHKRIPASCGPRRRRSAPCDSSGREPKWYARAPASQRLKALLLDCVTGTLNSACPLCTLFIRNFFAGLLGSLYFCGSGFLVHE
jgi:hypothetical protein